MTRRPVETMRQMLNYPSRRPETELRFPLEAGFLVQREVFRQIRRHCALFDLRLDVTTLRRFPVGEYVIKVRGDQHAVNGLLTLVRALERVLND